MTTKIQWAMKDERLVTLVEVKRGERGLTCYTCGDRLTVKDGGGRRVSGRERRNQAKRKHFSYTPNSKFYGEGPAHYRVKTAICSAINSALKAPDESRDSHGRIAYRCPDQVYGPKDYIKTAPGSGGKLQEFEELRHGYHDFDLLQHCGVSRFYNTPALDHAETEVWLDGRRTRADIAGKDKQGNVLWVIEIKRSTLSRAAIDYANLNNVPLFVIDLSKFPRPTVDKPWAELECKDYFVLAANLAKGHNPSVEKSYNTECERRAFGMGPDDHNWSRNYVYIHHGPEDCGSMGCPDCERVLLHECGEMLCPDSAYIFDRGITEIQMYTDPVHRAKSHAPPTSEVLNRWP